MSTGRRLVPVSELSRAETQLARLFATRTEPLGARTARVELEKMGVSLSEATISRLFARLDSSGYTRPVGRKGRVMTEGGRAAVQSVVKSEQTTSLLEEALDVRELDQLVDLLHARRGVEGEAVTLAAQRATDADLRDLRRNINLYGEEAHGGKDLGNDFHRLLIRAAHSPLIETMFSVMLEEKLASLEPVLLVITGGHGHITAAPDDHIAILEALERRDRKQARTILIDHLGRLIEEVQDFASRNDGPLFERLLGLAR